MRSSITMPLVKLISLSLLLTGCSVFTSKPTTPEVLHDSNIPIPQVYDVHGTLIPGYQGYSDGFVTNTLKACNAMMDKAGVH